MVDLSELKQLVKSAFDESIPYYISFEEKYRLYAFLAREMSIISDIKEGSMVCDVLGGTGASTRILSELVGDSGHVFSINFSDKLTTIHFALQATDKPHLKFIFSVIFSSSLKIVLIRFTRSS